MAYQIETYPDAREQIAARLASALIALAEAMAVPSALLGGELD